MEVEDEIQWIRKAGEANISRFSLLAPLEELYDNPYGEKDSRYLMYKIGSMLSGEKSRKYEFLIEFDTYLPSQGIYFGCKSITLPGWDHKEEILKADRDWKEIKDLVVRRLNNVFIHKDFTSRFKVTDNANNNTYWPFWISLHEDEDIWNVGVRALDIIRQSFKGVSGENWEFDTSLGKEIYYKEEFNSTDTAFTHKAFEMLQTNIKRNVKQSLTKNLLGKDEIYWKRFLYFLDKATDEGMLIQNDGYEKAWQMNERFKDTDFTAFIKVLFDNIGKTTEVVGFKIPWSNLIRVFMRADETPYKIQVKTLNVKEEKLRYWEDILSRKFK